VPLASDNSDHPRKIYVHIGNIPGNYFFLMFKSGAAISRKQVTSMQHFMDLPTSL